MYWAKLQNLIICPALTPPLHFTLVEPTKEGSPNFNLTQSRHSTQFPALRHRTLLIFYQLFSYDGLIGFTQQTSPAPNRHTWLHKLIYTTIYTTWRFISNSAKYHFQFFYIDNTLSRELPHLVLSSSPWHAHPLSNIHFGSTYWSLRHQSRDIDILLVEGGAQVDMERPWEFLGHLQTGVLDPRGKDRSSPSLQVEPVQCLTEQISWIIFQVLQVSSVLTSPPFQFLTKRQFHQLFTFWVNGYEDSPGY
jgi:hypothetical protein